MVATKTSNLRAKPGMPPPVRPLILQGPASQQMSKKGDYDSQVQIDNMDYDDDYGEEDQDNDDEMEQQISDDFTGQVAESDKVGGDDKFFQQRRESKHAI